MSAFRIRRIGGPSLGELLRERREARGQSRAALAAASRVQEKYLAAFEQDDYRLLPEPLYQRMFLKAIAAALDVPPASLLERHAADLVQSLSLAPPRRFLRIAEWKAFLVAPRIVTAFGLAVVSAALVGILVFEINRILVPPPLSLEAPADGQESAAPVILLRGRSERGALVRVNGVVVYLNQAGGFEERVHLHRGVNVIKISAKKKRSGERVLYRRVLWEGGTNDAVSVK